MASIAVVSRIPEHGAPTPFCDKNFKFARVGATFLSNLCLAIFHKALSFGSWAVSKHYYQHYKSLARYEFEMSMKHFFIYLIFGNQIIDFCFNSVTQIKEHIPGKVDELEALKKMYGSAAVERWLNIDTKEIPLIKEKLSRKEIADDGCCLGAALDFNARYLQKVRRGIAPLEAVREIAPLYRAGVPDEAALAQIFCEALRSTNAYKKAKELGLKKLEAKRKEKNDWLANEQKKIKETVPFIKTEIEKKLAKLEDEMREQMENFRIEGIFAVLITTQYVWCQQIAKPFGLTLKEPLIFGYNLDKKKTDATIAKLSAFIDKLPDGNYNLVISREKGPGHALAFVKTKEGYFLCDPDCATLVFDSSRVAARQLMNISESLVKKGICSFGFHRCD